MYFDLQAEAGKRGADGMILLALQLQRMLSSTSNAAPHLPDMQSQMTHVLARLEEASSLKTRAVLRQDGGDVGGEWDQAYEH